MNKVFLGGTCNDSTWREELISKLDLDYANPWREELYRKLQLDYFNPVVENWTPKCQENEINEKENKCNIHLYVITSAMTGVYSIAEAVDSVHCKKVKTILHVIPDGFDKGQLRSLDAVVNLINSRGGLAYIDSKLEKTVETLNNANYS